MDDDSIMLCIAHECFKIFFEMLDHLGTDSMCLLASLAPIGQGCKGGVAPAEAFAIHRELMSRRAHDIDPNIRVRLERARKALRLRKEPPPN